MAVPVEANTTSSGSISILEGSFSEIRGYQWHHPRYWCKKWWFWNDTSDEARHSKVFFALYDIRNSPLDIVQVGDFCIFEGLGRTFPVREGAQSPFGGSWSPCLWAATFFSSNRSCIAIFIWAMIVGPLSDPGNPGSKNDKAFFFCTSLTSINWDVSKATMFTNLMVISAANCWKLPNISPNGLSSRSMCWSDSL